MGLSKDQQFFSIIFFLLRNGEDFRLLYQDEEWKNVGNRVYCQNELVEWAYLGEDYEF